MSVDFAKMQEIFLAAVELHRPEDWDSFLDRACGGDDELRRQVHLLLKAHHEAGSVPGAASHELDQSGAHQAPPEAPGTIIGPYKLMEQIGEGGMGLVFVAEQQKPVHRKVALKVIKPGMDTRQVIARFEVERQALALMDHANIAKVLDAGQTSSGLPFFVMELVKGMPITEYCDQNQVPIRQRLELFVHVCQAVQHAHQKGIIHRDLKPSNVLVMSNDGTPVVKVIDFGVAKAIGQPLTDKTIYTQFAQMVGTPLYMSPEQAGQNGLDVDTRSDIYALGVLLYELLTGTTPFDKERMREAGYDEMRRIIREEEPPRPSTRVSTLGRAATTICTQRRSEPKRLSRLIRGELDWIMMKALDKDRSRRYETANDLARDVQRYLADEPVLACPPSAWYRFRKFGRRHKVRLGAAGLVAAFLIILGSGLGWVAHDRSSRQLLLRRTVEAALRQSDGYLQEGKWPQALVEAQRAATALSGGDAEEDLRQQTTAWLADLEMVARLEDFIASLPDRVRDSPDPAQTSDPGPAFASLFREYGIDVESGDPEEVAERLRARPTHVALAAALDEWAGEWLARPAAEHRNVRRLLAISRAADGHAWRGRVRDALAREDGKALMEFADSPQAAALPLRSADLLAMALARLGKRPKAIALLRQVQDQHADDFPVTLRLAILLLEGQQPSEAARFYQAALALRPHSMGPLTGLCRAFGEQRRWAEALALAQRTAELHPDRAMAHYNLGSCFRLVGKLDEAQAAFRAAIRLQPDLAPAHINLGMCLGQQRRWDEAVAAFQNAIRANPEYPQAYNNLGVALRRKGRFDDAIAAYRRAVQVRPDYPEAYGNLGNVLQQVGRTGEALAAYEQALRLRPDAPECCASVAWLLITAPDPKLRDANKALKLARQAVSKEPTRSMTAQSTGDGSFPWQVLGWALYRTGAWKESIEAFQRSMALQQNPKGGDAGQWFGLALAHCKLGHKEEARTWYDRAVLWTERYAPRNEEMRRFQAEAEQALMLKK